MPDPLLPRRRVLQRLLAASIGVPLFLRHARSEDRPRFTLGVASGSPTATSVVLWTRLDVAPTEPDVPVHWELAADEAFTRILRSGTEPARASDAHSVHLQLSGLEPDRWYWYRFTALGQRSMTGRTRTAPASGAAAGRLHFAIASCQRWEHGHWAAWRDAAAADADGRGLDLVLFLGDYIYEYASAPVGVRLHGQGAADSLPSYRERYALYKSDALLQAAHAACPWIVIWDDHEVDNDYAGLQGQGLDPAFAARRAAAYRAWWEHMPLPPALRPAGSGNPPLAIHGALDWGRLARLHWADGRQYRDPQPCARDGRGGSATVRAHECAALFDERSLFGAAQERWLIDGFSTAHPWNLLAQTTLMARFSTEAVSPARAEAPPQGRYWTDGWDGYPTARQRLLAAMHARKVPGAVVLSGDVHTNYVADLQIDPDDPASPVAATEFCGTSISSRSWPQRVVDAALPHNPHVRHGRSDQRGYVRFALSRDRLEADLRAVADVADADSAVRTQARFVVEAGAAGAIRQA
jgi:alkaline phosphatase D